MGRFRAKLPDGEFTVTVTCARCKDEVKLTTNKLDIHFSFHTCPACGRRFALDPDMDSWKPITLAVAVVLMLGVALPVLVVDKIIWTQLNEVSVRLQTWFVTDKYTLALVGFAAGLLAFPLLGGWKGCVDVLIWGALSNSSIRWCWGKALTDATEESEVRRLEDEVAIHRGRAKRMGRGLLGLLLFVPLYLTAGDPMFAGLWIMNLGYYWMDSTHVPPSKRGLMDWGRQFALGPGAA